MRNVAPRRGVILALVVPGLLALPVVAEAAVVPYSATPPLYRVGDDPRWSAPETNEHAWSSERPRAPGNWWIRTTVTLERDLPATEDVALRVLAPGAVEIYWDGRSIGGDGVIGHDAVSERPGLYGVWAALAPDRRSAGDHVAAVRVSSHRTAYIRGPIGISLLDRGATERVEGLRTAFFLFCAGMLLITGLVFGLLSASTGPSRDTVLFAWLTALVGALLLLEYAKFILPYPYTWHFPRLIAISTLTFVVGVLLPLFVSARLALGRLRLLALFLPILYAGFLILYPDPDEHSLNILRAAIATSFVLASAGVALRRAGSVWILVAVTANFVPIFFTGLRYADHWFFVGFLVMVAVLLLQMARWIRRQARERDAALLQSERLRHELLEKRIQPHFLMNSLAVAISHIEEEPPRGIRMLRDLADELQAFFAIGERDSISIAEELELCRRHVRTMRHVLDRSLELVVEDDGSIGTIPPGVLLTLVENSITHGGRGETRIVIRDGTIDVENATRARDEEAIREGAGLCYVRAQLARESFVWTIEHGRRDGRWRTRLARLG